MSRHLALVSAVCLTALTNALAQQPSRQEKNKDDIWTAQQLREVLEQAQRCSDNLSLFLLQQCSEPDTPGTWFDGIQWENFQRSQQNVFRSFGGGSGFGGGPPGIAPPPALRMPPPAIFKDWREERWKEENPWQQNTPPQKQPVIDSEKLNEMLRHLQDKLQLKRSQPEERGKYEFRSIFDRGGREYFSPFDGIQWEWCRTRGCPVRG
jgi:hypothetical protein